MFNEYTFGGPLILSGIKAYIDGRAEMYGDDFMANYAAMMTNDIGAFERTVTKFNIQWVVLPWTEKYMVRELGKSGGWCKIYGDQLGLVAVRKAGPFVHLCHNLGLANRADVLRRRPGLEFSPAISGSRDAAQTTARS